MWCLRQAQIGPPQCTYGTRLWRWPYARRWSEPVDLPLALSQTKLNWWLAVVEAKNYSATYDMQAQCGAGGQPKSDFLSAICGCGDGPTQDNGLSRLISVYYYPKLN